MINILVDKDCDGKNKVKLPLMANVRYLLKCCNIKLKNHGNSISTLTRAFPFVGEWSIDRAFAYLFVPNHAPAAMGVGTAISLSLKKKKKQKKKGKRKKLLG